MKHSPLLQTVAKIVLPPAILFAVYLLSRGHNLPGGGFVAGLMTAAAVILQYVARGEQGHYGHPRQFNTEELTKLVARHLQGEYDQIIIEDAISNLVHKKDLQEVNGYYYSRTKVIRQPNSLDAPWIV